MNARRIVYVTLLSLILFPCLLVVNKVLMIYQPEFNTSISNLFFSIAEYVFFAVCIILSIFLLQKSERRKLWRSRRDMLLEAKYKNVVEDSGISTITIDSNGIIRFSSQNINRLAGYETPELIGNKLQQFIAPEFHELIDNIITGAIAKDNYEDTIQVQLLTKNNSRVWISSRLYPLPDRYNNVNELVLMLWDIENEKKMQLQMAAVIEAKNQQAQLLQTVIDYCPTLVYMKIPGGDYVLSNAKTKQVMHVASNEELKQMLHTKYPEMETLHTEKDMLVVETKGMVTYESDVVQDNGNVTNLFIQKFPIFDKDGNVEFICGFSTDITLFKQSEQIILQAKKDAEQARDAQETFLANMSHEIRTPLNGIVGMGNLLLATKVTDEQKDYLESIQESAKNLLAIINDLLDFSKIKSGKFNLEAIDFKPRDVIRKTMYPLLLRANEKGLALKCFIDTDVPETINGDALRFQQIVINLVANAIKFTEKGYVEVKIYPVSLSNHVVMLGVDVIDTGIGIPEDKINHIFESYVQSDTNISRIYGGTGLGLAIVKQLAEIQMGSVSASSRLGSGSTFSVHIPYKICESVQETTTVSTNNAINSNGKSAILKDIKVLVVEDNIINQKVVKQTLIKQNALVEVAGNGKIAIEKLNTEPFDIVLMDLQMPEMDGYTATQHIRQVMKNTIPIVAMTADALKGESDKCFEIGMNDYISKPFEPGDLYRKILHLTQHA